MTVGGVRPHGSAGTAEVSHQACHLVLAHVVTLVDQFLVDPGRAIGAVGGGVDRSDLLEQLGVGQGSGRGDGPLALLVGGPRTWKIWQHAFRLRPATSSASMKGSSFTGSPERREPLPA